MAVEACALPGGALLGKFATAHEYAGAYTDCFAVTIDRAVTLSDFVSAFYTTPLFKLERVILKYLFAKPSTDTEARRLADGSCDAFAAWSVEERTDEQLLMCDFRERTRSWFMVTRQDGLRPQTTLQFGSAVVPGRDSKTGQRELGRGVGLLLELHKLYSRFLLSSAQRRLERGTC